MAWNNRARVYEQNNCGSLSQHSSKNVYWLLSPAPPKLPCLLQTVNSAGVLGSVLLFCMAPHLLPISYIFVEAGPSLFLHFVVWFGLVLLATKGHNLLHMIKLCTCVFHYGLPHLHSFFSQGSLKTGALTSHLLPLLPLTLCRMNAPAARQPDCL